MSCNVCETGFQGGQSLVVSITKFNPTTALLYLQNQGRNIIQVRLILLSYATSGSSGTMFLRPPGAGGIDWVYPSAFLEPGLSALYYQLTVQKGWLVQAQAEFIEIEGRSRSCPETF